MGLYERGLESVARTQVGYWYVRRIAPKIDPALLRLTSGRVSTVYPAPVMLLTTTGAKTGRSRTHPLLYVVDGDALLLIASNYGNPGNPAWYTNLTANPTVEVLAGKHSGTYIAAEVTDPNERDRAWAQALDVYAGYADYEVRAGGRKIPLIRLECISDGSANRA
jgi:deazaflavin-dependent oxidoreductase (nitroreductase family)